MSSSSLYEALIGDWHRAALAAVKVTALLLTAVIVLIPDPRFGP